jgi:hypothetical protein
VAQRLAIDIAEAKAIRSGSSTMRESKSTGKALTARKRAADDRAAISLGCNFAPSAIARTEPTGRANARRVRLSVPRTPHMNEQQRRNSGSSAALGVKGDSHVSR